VGGIRSEENLKEFSGMMALLVGSEDKAGQDTGQQLPGHPISPCQAKKTFQEISFRIKQL